MFGLIPGSIHSPSCDSKKKFIMIIIKKGLFVNSLFSNLNLKVYLAIVLGTKVDDTFVPICMNVDCKFHGSRLVTIDSPIYD